VNNQLPHMLYIIIIIIITK